MNLIFNNQDNVVISGNMFTNRTLDNVTISNTGSGNYSVHRVAFYEQTINSLTLKDGLVSIGESAFFGATINSITIEDQTNPYSIGNSAFYNTTFQTFNLGANISSIGASVFESGTLDTNPMNMNLVFNNQNNVVISGSMFRNRTLGNVTISNTGAGNYSVDTAFQQLSIESLTLKDGLVSIGTAAFVSATINTFTIEDQTNPYSIGHQAFYTATIQTFDLIANISSIGTDAFRNSTINSIRLKDGLVSIGDNAFRESTIDSITIDSQSQSYSIGNSAFRDSTINSITIASQSQPYSIGSYAFYNVDMQQVSLSSNISSIGAERTFGSDTLDSNPININLEFNGGDANVPYQTFLNRTLDNVSISNTGSGNYSVGDNAFKNMTINSMILKNGLASIGESAFSGATINTFTIEDQTQSYSIGINAFYNLNMRSISLSTNRITPVVLPNNTINANELNLNQNLTNMLVIGNNDLISLSSNNVVNNTKFINVVFDQDSIQYLQNKSVVLLDCSLPQ